MTNITIDGSTVVCPTRADPFVNSTPTVHIPIDGEAVVEESNHQDSFGEMNAIRTMEWDGLPTSSTSWTHTTATLKALEGESVVLNMPHFGYTTTQNIKVVSVDIEWLVYDGTTNWYTVALNYHHR